ncbi:hypothetical protein QN277_005756 [Acacia crassicarpa]|uniref:F-box domain-containing protein n=1 Tax=Acacia crassicarpa TaxID=499986 RepID=A0AAE1IZU3_9FABA|nr:hypothetical protein QN277_005756 [Acacia crassicarpa]
MEKTVINGAAAYLPDEIITNILRMLPVKSLLRFQSVCKYWKNLFKTPSFIADHLRHSDQHPFLLLSQDYVLVLDTLQSLRLLDYKMQVQDVPKSPLFDSLCPSCFDTIGCSNGLLCFAITGKPDRLPPSLLLWNPLTNDAREVPRSRNIDSDVFDCALGFGFSPIVSDHNILAIYTEYGGMVYRADLYSLSRGSWKEIEVGNIENVTCFQLTVSSNGAIFIYGLKPSSEPNWQVEGVIVSFDMTTEVFTLISWPPLLGHSSFDLTIYEDKLAVISDHRSRGSSIIDLWVMVEDISSSTERWSWTKKFTSGHYPWNFTFGIVWRNNIVVSGIEIGCEIEKNKPCLCLFNVTSNEFNRLETPGYSSPYLLNFVESLIPVVNIHNNEEC